MTYGYKLIVRYFKEVGFYEEFKEYCNTSYVGGRRCHRNFREDEIDPLKNFGCTSISNWVENTKGIRFTSGNLYDHFKAWLFVFYPEFYPKDSPYCCGNPSTKVLEHIDKDKRTVKIEYRHYNTNFV